LIIHEDNPTDWFVPDSELGKPMHQQVEFSADAHENNMQLNKL
jgi:hypothetical protein